MNLFLDTNVVLDYVAAREPFCRAIRQIIRESEKYDLHFMCASMTFTTMEYILKKHVSHELLMNMFINLRQIIQVVPSDSKAIDLAINSSFIDFEDAVQHYTAISGKADVIITRNAKDFITASIIPVLTPQEFVDKYMK